MNRIGHIYLALPIFAAVLMLQQCGRGMPDDPRIARGKEMVELVLSQRELGDAVKVQYEIDSRMEADPGDLNGETYRSVLEGNRLRITGSGPAGILYGSGEAARRILDSRPAETGTESLVGIPGFDILESPRMHLRGVGLLLMKLGTYNYPITPEEFPFFYDRELWIDYLDFLERNRYNYIAFWNGHPFSYFAHLSDYPEAQEGMLSLIHI